MYPQGTQRPTRWLIVRELPQTSHPQLPVILPTTALPAVRASLWQVPFSLFTEAKLLIHIYLATVQCTGY